MCQGEKRKAHDSSTMQKIQDLKECSEQEKQSTPGKSKPTVSQYQMVRCRDIHISNTIYIVFRNMNMYINIYKYVYTHVLAINEKRGHGFERFHGGNIC